MPLNLDVHGMTITIKSPTVTGGEVSWPTTRGTFKGYVTNVQAQEISGGDGRVDVSSMVLIAPAGAGIVTGDQVEFQGRAYDCLGSSDTWKRYTRAGAVSHLEVPLRGA